MMNASFALNESATRAGTESRCSSQESKTSKRRRMHRTGHQWSCPCFSSCMKSLSPSHGQHHFVLCMAATIGRRSLPCGLCDGSPNLRLLLGWILCQQRVKPRQDRLLKTEVIVDGSPFERHDHWFSLHRSEASLREKLL